MNRSTNVVKRQIVRALAALAVVLTTATGLHAAPWDVVVYGGSPGGIAAALAAARDGRKVVVIEPTKHIGGMITGGLSRTDVGNQRVIGGIALEFFHRAASHYGDVSAMKGHEAFFSEPHVAERTFKAMLEEAKVTVLTGRRLTGVAKQGAKITAITTDDGTRHEAPVFIDASYEGDVMARAGVSYIVGREGREKYGEELAGFNPAPLRPRTIEEMSLDDPCIAPGTKALHYVHGTPTKISPYDSDGKLLPGVVGGPWPEAGAGDHRIMGYNFRVIVTRRDDLRVPWPRPANYDPARYELLRRIIAAYPGIRFSKLVHLGEVRNGKFDANNIGLVIGTNHTGRNYDYPDGDWPARDRIWAEHVDWVQGYFYFLANDPSLPEDLRKQAREWGLCRDEFVDNGHWPHHLYVRVARRMIGRHVMTQHDAQRTITKPDTIGMGSFILDSHAVQRLVHPDGYVIDEGNFDVPVKPYEIPYRALTPAERQCENLLVVVCMSASYVAYGSLRMEPQYMIMGHAAGLAASMALAEDKPVQAIDVAQLQRKLRSQKAILSWADAAGGENVVRATSFGGIVADDLQAELTGHWQIWMYGGIDGSYQHDMNEHKGDKAARLAVDLPRGGTYEVLLGYSPYANRATNVPVTIHHAGGTAVRQVNQRQKPDVDGHFVSLGRYRFEAGPAVIVVGTAGTDGYVTVDAVRFVEAQ